jgi:hypothetical protein
MFTVQGAFAAADVCVAVPVGATTPYSAIIGVASNFFEPAKVMLNNFQNTAAGTGKTFLLCHNSTATLEANIGNYDMLFAADDSAATNPNYSTSDEDYEPFTYARGVPVIFAPKTASGPMSTPAGLISGLTATELSNSSTNNGPGGWSGYSVAGTSSTGLIGTAASVAIAGTGAPYGQAAYKILNNMMATSLPGTFPSPTNWIFTPLPDNISLTFNAVTTNSVDVNGDGTNEDTSSVQAGFVGMSQICTPGPLANYVYVAFTNNAYTLAQTVAITPAATGTALTTVEGLYNFIQTAMGPGGGWSSFLTSNCYQNPS